MLENCLGHQKIDIRVFPDFTFCIPSTYLSLVDYDSSNVLACGKDVCTLEKEAVQRVPRP